jgi:transcriptional regulator with XRE-family HTH domain
MATRRARPNPPWSRRSRSYSAPCGAVGLSQERLGHDAGSGRTYISQLERGEKGPSLNIVFRLALHLKTTATEIVSRVEANVDAWAEAHVFEAAAMIRSQNRACRRPSPFRTFHT